MKIIRALIILLIILSLSVSSYAAGTKGSSISIANKSTGTAAKQASKDALQHKPGMKAERGVKNILFGWTEIPKSIIQVTRDSKNPFWGFTGGALKGFGKAYPRTVSGIADVVSFPIADYDKMLVSPDELTTHIK